jgi:hypothetical protein
MKRLLPVVLIFAAAAGCALPGTAEDFTWHSEIPKTVDRGAEFLFAVRAIDKSGQEVKRLRYRYQILWTGGASNPLRHTGYTGEVEKIHARMISGPAVLVVTAPNREGLETKVLEATIEVK